MHKTISTSQKETHTHFSIRKYIPVKITMSRSVYNTLFEIIGCPDVARKKCKSSLDETQELFQLSVMHSISP